jgi:hypothetical protein
MVKQAQGKHSCSKKVEISQRKGGTGTTQAHLAKKILYQKAGGESFCVLSLIHLGQGMGPQGLEENCPSQLCQIQFLFG